MVDAARADARVHGRRLPNPQTGHPLRDELEQEVVHRGVGVGRDEDGRTPGEQDPHREGNSPRFACGCERTTERLNGGRGWVGERLLFDTSMKIKRKKRKKRKNLVSRRNVKARST